jgi:hypothetical protein
MRSGQYSQFRECLIGEERYRLVIHDRDAIYSKDVDLLVKTTGLQILKTPAQSPQANAFCERLIGTFVEDNKSSIERNRFAVAGSNPCLA